MGEDTVIGGAGDDRLKGGAGNDKVEGGVGDDDINAGTGDDTVEGGQGNDRIDGKNGIDTALYSGSILDYDFSINDDLEVTITDTVGSDGTDRLKHVEFLQFSDFLYEVGGNNAPVSLDQAIIVNEADGSYVLDLSTQVTDVDGDPLTFSNIAIERGETLIPFTILGGGLVRIDPDFGLDAGQSLTTTLRYLVTDGELSDTGIVPIIINGADDPPPPVNAPPVADDLTVVADEEDGPVIISLSALITDPNFADIGDILTITSVRVDAGDPSFPNALVPFSGGVTSGDGGDLILDIATLGLAVDEGETQTFLLNYAVEDDVGLSDTGVITLNLIGDTPGAGNTPPVALDIPGAPGYPSATDPFGGGVIPGDVLVDDPTALTFTIDMNDLISDAETADANLVVTFGDLVLGLGGGGDGGATTAPFNYDATTKSLTITLADIGLSDGEEVLGTLEYSVSDGIDSTSGQIVVNFVDPLNAPIGPIQRVLDFEDLSDEAGAQIVLPTLNEPLQAGDVLPEYRGFGFRGEATVIETNELGGDGRNPTGIKSGQTTPEGENVLVGTFNTIVTSEPVLDEEGEPVRGEDGLPLVIVTETLDNAFAILAPGLTFGPGDLGTSVNIPSLPDPLPEGAGTPFDLNGLSLNLADGAGQVAITTYGGFVVEETDINGFPSFNLVLEATDSFVFDADSATPAELLDFEAVGFADDVGNTNAAAFDGIYAVEFTTDTGAAVVLDDILLTV
ncbi:calcium-binding protein [Aestuariicoccus sp. MJ-SS9]|uniref:calcium-binding protein n=1 Tax=Aestuariicoccus sp. MJ-SS9 TaxID=3079855 RepID=UPI0039775FC1